MSADLPKRKPILCLDFDGVIHSYHSGWQGPRNIPDLPVPGALAFLELAREEFDVQIYSSRSRYWGGRRAMKKWLLSHLIDYYYNKFPQYRHDTIDPFGEEDIYWKMSKDLIGSIKFPVKKPAAFLQIDDRAICFTGTFPKVTELLAFRPWNKKIEPVLLVTQRVTQEEFKKMFPNGID